MRVAQHFSAGGVEALSAVRLNGRLVSLLGIPSVARFTGYVSSIFGIPALSAGLLSFVRSGLG